MAGWDEPNKIIGGLNLLSARIIDRDTMRENIDGLENHGIVHPRSIPKTSRTISFKLAPKHSSG